MPPTGRRSPSASASGTSAARSTASAGVTGATSAPPPARGPAVATLPLRTGGAVPGGDRPVGGLGVLWLSVLWLSVWLSVVWPTSSTLVVVVGLLVDALTLARTARPEAVKARADRTIDSAARWAAESSGSSSSTGSSWSRPVPRSSVRAAPASPTSSGSSSTVRGLGELEAVAAERGVEDGGHRAGQVAELRGCG